MDALIETLAAVPSLLWSGASFFLGALLGHRLQLGRDRRLERQAALVPIRTWLIKQIEHPLEPLQKPSNTEFDAYTSRLGTRRRKKLRRPSGSSLHHGG